MDLRVRDFDYTFSDMMTYKGFNFDEVSCTRKLKFRSVIDAIFSQIKRWAKFYNWLIKIHLYSFVKVGKTFSIPLQTQNIPDLLNINLWRYCQNSGRIQEA